MGTAVSKPAVKVYRDGREVCQGNAAGKREYRARLMQAWLRDGKVCGICHYPVCFEDMVPDHIKPRKMGGSERDDRVDNLQAAHCRCNTLKGSKRI